MSDSTLLDSILNSLCRSYLAHNLSLDVCVAKFASFCFRHNHLMRTLGATENLIDINDADSIFIERANSIATDRDLTRALIASYSEKAFSEGLSREEIFATASVEAINPSTGAHILTGLEVGQIIDTARDIIAIRKMARRAFADNVRHAEIKTKAVALAPTLDDGQIRKILRDELADFKATSHPEKVPA